MDRAGSYVGGVRHWIVAFVVLLATAVHAGRIGVGDHAPRFRLPARGGGDVTLDGVRGHAVVIDFWASWCLTCQVALPALDELARRAEGKGVRMLAVNVDRSRAAAEAFLRRRLPSPALTVLFDPEGDLLARFGADSLPALYVLDGTGVVRYVESGGSLEETDALEKALRDLETSKP